MKRCVGWLVGIQEHARGVKDPNTSGPSLLHRSHRPGFPSCLQGVWQTIAQTRESYSVKQSTPRTNFQRMNFECQIAWLIPGFKHGCPIKTANASSEIRLTPEASHVKQHFLTYSLWKSRQPDTTLKVEGLVSIKC